MVHFSYNIRKHITHNDIILNNVQYVQIDLLSIDKSVESSNIEEQF